jgi:23S rRNA pseudouridine1911/1915/1917 synthase
MGQMEEVKIVFENGDYLVFNKPAGLVTTNENGRELESLELWLKNKYGDNGLKRQGIAHRLDKGTSGLVLVAKTEEYLDYFLRLFKSRKINKKYLALVSGEASFDGSVNMPIGRNGHIFGKFGVKSEGKNALTLFKRIALISYENTCLPAGRRSFSLVKIDLKTGRTHQIRVHFAYLGWPLVSDKVYGGKMVGELTRPFLHSCEISFIDMEGKLVKYRSELANDLKNTLKLMGYENN